MSWKMKNKQEIKEQYCSLGREGDLLLLQTLHPFQSCSIAHLLPPWFNQHSYELLRNETNGGCTICTYVHTYIAIRITATYVYTYIVLYVHVKQWSAAIELATMVSWQVYVCNVYSHTYIDKIRMCWQHCSHFSVLAWLIVCVHMYIVVHQIDDHVTHRVTHTHTTHVHMHMYRQTHNGKCVD